MIFLYLILTALAFVLGTVFGFKRATQYRRFPVFQYAMLIAHTAPEEWEQKSDGLRHPEIGHLCRRMAEGRFILNEETIPENMHNQLRDAIRDGHLRVKIRERTERIAKEQAEAVAKMNEATKLQPRKFTYDTEMGVIESNHAQFVHENSIPYPQPRGITEIGTIPSHSLTRPEPPIPSSGTRLVDYQEPKKKDSEAAGLDSKDTFIEVLVKERKQATVVAEIAELMDGRTKRLPIRVVKDYGNEVTYRFPYPGRPPRP